MQIITCNNTHTTDIIIAISQSPDWEIFTTPDKVDLYKESLINSITFVAYEEEVFCGYIRAIEDPDFAVYVSELFVVPAFRNRGIGHALLEKVKVEYSHLTVYALSDEDLYYEKKGYQKIGSVFDL